MGPLYVILYLIVMVSRSKDRDLSLTSYRVEGNHDNSPPNAVEFLTHPMQEEDITARYYTNTFDARASGLLNFVGGDQNNIYRVPSSVRKD